MGLAAVDFWRGTKGPDAVTYQCNPERHIDMVQEAFGRFRFSRDVLLPEQRAIYGNLAAELVGETVLEAGCGCGFGTAILAQTAKTIIGTDVAEHHVAFAQVLYPRIQFDTWDIKQGPYVGQADVVVAVEVIEHIEDVEAAIRNLIASATKRVYFSSPNRNNKGLGQGRPHNNFHVKEYTPEEIIETVPGADILAWDTFAILEPDTDITPLVYRIDA